MTWRSTLTRDAVERVRTQAARDYTRGRLDEVLFNHEGQTGKVYRAHLTRMLDVADAKEKPRVKEKEVEEDAGL